jgi:hypothetical protein
VVRRAPTELLSDALSVTHRGKFRGSPRFAGCAVKAQTQQSRRRATTSGFAFVPKPCRASSSSNALKMPDAKANSTAFRPRLVEVLKDEQDYDDRPENNHPIGNLNASYRCFPLEPFHCLPPR